MAKKNQHVVPLWNGWAIKGEGNKKYTTIADTKAQAEKIAKEIAKNNKSELIIQARNSYGNDPRSTRG